MESNFYEITEKPGDMATAEQLERLYCRYRFAKDYINKGQVLEVGCGSGMGLVYLSESASKVVGGDIDKNNIELASQYCTGNTNISVIELDAHKLPFPDKSFDVILLFESIYYLENPKGFIEEAFRGLTNNGHLVIGSVNKDWKDFHPSKYAVKYYSVPELDALLRGSFNIIEFFGAFEVDEDGIKSKMYSLIKGSASKLNLIPGSLKARELLKRIFIGRLAPIPPQVFDDMAVCQAPVKIEDHWMTNRYKIFYAVAQK